MFDNATLLKRYARDRDESAFTELVKRHVNLVFGTARRITGDIARAQEVSQSVFADLARKASSLSSEVVIEGWLYRAACLAAAKVVRDDVRRNERERQAMEAQGSGSAGEPDQLQAKRLQPVLDQALGQLPNSDREAVVLRFLAGHSFAELGTLLGCTEGTAQKRVSRALERLRELFRKRGITTTEGVLSLALALAGAQVAPSGVAAAVMVTALASLETTGWIHTLMMMKTKIALTGVVIALVVTPLTWQHLALKQLDQENRALRTQADQLPALRAEHERLSQLVPTSNERERLSDERLELMRLRAEVGQLRAAQRAAGQPAPVAGNTTGPTFLGQTRTLLPPTTRRIPDGMTLVAGGWTTPDGKRGLMLVTPQVGGEGEDAGSQVTVSCTLLEGSPDAFTAVGLGDVASGGTSATPEVLTPEAAAALVRRLAETGDVDVLAAPRVTTLDGRQAQIASGVGGGLATAIDILPSIDTSADGATVEMTLFVTQTPMETPPSAPVTMPLPMFTNPAEDTLDPQATAPSAIQTTLKPQP